MSVKIYEGHEITKDIIAKIKQILASITTDRDFKHYDKIINSVQDISLLNNVPISEIKLFLDSDWYLIISESSYDVNLIEWVSKENKPNTFSKSIKMYKVFREILLQNKGKIFKADLMQKTSYRLYKRLASTGLIKEISNNCYSTSFFKKFNIRRVIRDLNKINNPATLANIIDENEFKLESYLQYFYHSVSFTINESFYEKYERTLRKKDS